MFFSDWTLDEKKQARKELEENLISGVRSIMHGDKRTDFRTVADMKEGLRLLEDAIAAEEGSALSVRQITPYTSKGF